MRGLCAELARETRPLALRSTGLIDFGGGVAIGFAAEGLAKLHARLRRAFAGRLTRQDDRPLRPHVTVQNKVDRATAIATRDLLSVRLPPLRGTGTGLELWHYRDGPWQSDRVFPFRGGGAAPAG